jgi:putative tributyrin esterase
LQVNLRTATTRALTLALLLIVSFAVACKGTKTAARIDPVLVNDTVTVQDVHIPSKLVSGDFWYRAIVPKVAQNERLPVLYFLHGANSGPTELTQQLKLTDLASAERMVIVVPDGRYSYYTNAKHGSGSRWEDAITTELIGDVEARLPVLRGREHRGVAGISMGGYGAVKIALKHPDLYSFAGSMSGAFDITDRDASLKRWGQTWRKWAIFGVQRSERKDEQIETLLHSAPDVQGIRWFVSCGETDPLLPASQHFVGAMRARKVDLTLVSTPGGHEWTSWIAAAPRLFRSAATVLK